MPRRALDTPTGRLTITEEADRITRIRWEDGPEDDTPLLLEAEAQIRAYFAGERRSFDLPLRRSDVADFLGLTTETVSRHLTKLRKSGVIEIVSNRHFTIVDMARLKHRSG